MHSTLEPTVHDKLAQAQYEEMLKARVLNQAQIVYNEFQYQGRKFEVVISYYLGVRNRECMTATLIVHLAACRDGSNPKDFLKRLLQSEGESTVERAYESLIDALRVKMDISMMHADEEDLEDAWVMFNEL
ncbi:unnamed protein product [Alternaria alternata]